MNAVLTKLARPLELLLALIFVAGVVLKALDINTFAVQISAYGVISGTAHLARTALAVLGVETFLAVLLLLGPRARTVLYSGVFLLLTGFTILIAYGWAFHDLEDCGCFGPLEMSPALSIAKNLLMMCIAGLAWRGFPGSARSWPDTLKKAAVAGIVALGLAVGVSTTVEDVKPDAPRPYARFALTTEQGYFDLGTGEYLVVLLSMGCDHCKAEVPKLNALLYHPDLPPLVGLCYEEFEGEIDEFRTETWPEFPMHSLGTQTLLFFDLLRDSKEPPRLVYVRDGAEVLAWDYTMPDPETVAATVQAARAE